ncbi:hypothetical protein GF1_20540 [Desulfolithobacter dissulfuricans]|uniref:Uncharacterized protein n=1 Tax=Desulfolithobacter dissulfuricans TaxID=2795293 RepID=A0A915U1H0_9BACT|nr:hypothetical protein GF1_20540 [Desulfolithobacter dissulfuricans]
MVSRGRDNIAGAVLVPVNVHVHEHVNGACCPVLICCATPKALIFPEETTSLRPAQTLMPRSCRSGTVRL